MSGRVNDHSDMDSRDVTSRETLKKQLRECEDALATSRIAAAETERALVSEKAARQKLEVQCQELQDEFRSLKAELAGCG